MKHFNITIFSTILITGLLFISGTAYGQAVSINPTGTAPDAQSILDITSTTKGVLLPRMTTAQRNAINPSAGADFGMVIYNTSTSTYDYWDGSAWQQIPNANGIVTSLDGAYDGGGSGAGRSITVDAGSVQMNGTGGAVALETDGDIQLAEDQWIGLGSTIERIEFDGSLNRIDIESADLTMNDGKWIGIDGSSPRIEFEDASGRLNMQDADIEVDNGAWIGLNASNPRIEFDDTNDELNILDADLGVGTTAPDDHSLADFRSSTKGILFPRMTTAERDAIGQGTNTDYGLWIFNEDSDHYNYWDGNSWEEVVPTTDLDSDDDWYQTTSTNTPTAIGDWIYTNGNVGINVGSTAGTLPLAALHAQSNAYIGDYTGAGFFNSNATLHLAKTDNTHLLLEDIGNNTGGFSFNSNGLNVVTENGSINFKTGITYNGDFSSTGTERVTILNNGNVGIGTVTPDTKLHVDQQTNGFNVPMVVRNSASNTNGDVVGIGLVNEQVEYGNFYKAAMVHERTAGFGVGKLHFLVDDAGDANSVALTESRMTILPDGNVGIGTTAPSVKLEVDGDVTISGKFNSNGIQESSDMRFKKDISNLEGALDNVMKLQGVSYNWRIEEFPTKNFSDRTEIGVIAQELEKVYPELVSTDSKGYKSVQYSHLVPVLIEAIKEQQNTIEGLNGTVTGLTSSIEALNAQMNELKAQVDEMNIDVKNAVIKTEVSSSK